MPSFEVEFEVFCGTCGAGLCNQADGRNSHRRGQPQVTVEVCDTCLGRLRDDLEATIDDLRSEVEALEELVKRYEQSHAAAR